VLFNAENAENEQRERGARKVGRHDPKILCDLSVFLRALRVESAKT
jgi:hypothetical protein